MSQILIFIMTENALSIELNTLQQTNKKYIVYEFCNGDHGIGSEFHMMVPSFAMAYHTNRTFLLKGSWIFGDFNTWFESLNINNIQLSKKNLIRYSQGMKMDKIQFIVVDPMTSYTTINKEYGAPPDKYKKHGIVWWKSQLIRYLMRPNNYLKKLIAKEKESLKLKSIDFIALQIRHSNNWTSATRKNASVAEYMALLEPIIKETGIKTIFVSTEDQQVINELGKIVKYKFIWTKNKRTNQNQAKAILSGKLNGHIEGQIGLVNLFIMREASHFVGGITSNWGRLVLEHTLPNKDYICKSIDCIPIKRYSAVKLKNKKEEFSWYNNFYNLKDTP